MQPLDNLGIPVPAAEARREFEAGPLASVWGEP